MAITENTLQSLYDHLLFISGQNSRSLKIADAVRLFNYALNDYTHLALSADGKWKAADRLESGLNAYETSVTGEQTYLLDVDFVRIDRLELTNDEGTFVIDPVDRKDYQDRPLSEVFPNGTRPLVYDLDGSSLSIYPAPTSGTLTIYPSLPFGHFTSTTLTAEVGIPPHHVEFLVFHALHRLGIRLNDSNRAVVRQELEVLKRRVMDDYSKRDEDTPRRIKGMVNVIE